MTVRKLLVYPDPRLKQRSAECGGVDDAVRAVLDDLADTLDSEPGVGIAAPQIAAPIRAVLVDMGRCSRAPDGSNHGRLFLVNPVILAREGVRRGREGCMSVPEVLADVARAAKIRVRFLDRGGDERTLDIEGFEATAVQHEPDHLDGVLFVDRVTSLARGLLRRGALKPKKGAPDLAAEDALVELLAGHLQDGRESVRRAVRLAMRIHAGQTRDEGTPYVEHPIRVARTLGRDLGVADPDVLAAALLHDVLEDAAANGHALSEADVAAEVGPRAARLVALLTKEKVAPADKPARDAAYFARLASGPREALLVKLADRLDNVRGLGASPDAEKRRRYVRETAEIFLPLARTAGVLEAELLAALAAVVTADGLPGELSESVARPG